MLARRQALVALLAGGAIACGGSPSGPGPVPTPTPPADLHDVTGVVFYDENGNGKLDATEAIRLGGVSVQIGQASGTSAPKTGDVVVKGVPAGSAQAIVSDASLPPYFVPPSAVSLTVPLASGTQLALPVTLPIGPNNHANRYMGFGDSITVGDGSSDGNGYLSVLQDELAKQWGGQPIMVNEGIEGTDSNEGAARAGYTVAQRRPAYTLIHYGTNDWNACGTQVPCFTIDSLRTIVQSVKGGQSLPVLATIIPANPAFPDKVPPQRNEWVHQIDALIRDLAVQEHVTLADMEKAFLAQPSLPPLFSDHVHPNDAGYQIMADVWLAAITGPRGGASSARATRSRQRPAPQLLPTRPRRIATRPAR